MTDVRSTQVGAEAWTSDPGATRPTQVGAEAWCSSATVNTQVSVTQVGAEVWVQVPHGGVRPVLFVVC